MPLTEALPSSELFANNLGPAAEAREALFVGSRDFVAVVAFSALGILIAFSVAALYPATHYALELLGQFP